MTLNMCYRQAIDIQDNSCLMTKDILLPRQYNLDLTIFCFLSGLCPRTKKLKFIISNCTHLQTNTGQPSKPKVCK